MRISRCWHACSAAAQQAQRAQQALHAQHAPRAQQAREAAAAAAAAGALHSRVGEAAAAAGRLRAAAGSGQRRQPQLTGMRPLRPTGAVAKRCCAMCAPYQGGVSPVSKKYAAACAAGLLRRLWPTGQ